MAHFALINARGLVEQVIVAEQDVIDTGLFGNPSSWVQTSYNTHGGQHPEGRPLRKNYAGIGFTYDPVRDAFIPPKPFASWTLNEDTCLWDCPVAYPEDGKRYTWDEASLAWVEVIAEEAPVIVAEEVTSNDTITLTSDTPVESVIVSEVAAAQPVVDIISEEPTITLDLGTASATPTV